MQAQTQAQIMAQEKMGRMGQLPGTMPRRLAQQMEMQALPMTMQARMAHRMTARQASAADGKI